MPYKIFAFLLFSFLLGSFIACSDDSSSTAPVIDDSVVGESGAKSSSSKGEQKKSSSSFKPGTVYDTLVIADTLVIVNPIETPYYTNDSSEFNWDELISNDDPSSSSVATQKPQSSSSSSPSSSSVKKEPSSSSVKVDPPKVEPPVVQGDSLIDTRDGNIYKLTMVGKTMWMATNINYETSNGSSCYDVTDCSKGALYDFSALSEVCPSGWRLPTRNEFDAASQDPDFPWSFGGRMKNYSYAYQGNMGFYWLATSEKFVDGDMENCSGDNCAMIFVKKSPDYGEGEFLFQKDSKDKGFSVRCVKN